MDERYTPEQVARDAQRAETRRIAQEAVDERITTLLTPVYYFTNDDTARGLRDFVMSAAYEALREHVEHFHAAPPTRGQRVQAWLRRNNIYLYRALAVALLFLSGLGLGLML